MDFQQREWAKITAFGDRCRQLASLDLSQTIIAVDFDGTCAMHDFPQIGEDVPGAVDVLKALQEAGAKLILWTMRSDFADVPIIGSPTETGAGEFLSHAAEWFKERGITLHALNNNPQQATWTSSQKVYAHAYIDDAAIDGSGNNAFALFKEQRQKQLAAGGSDDV